MGNGTLEEIRQKIAASHARSRKAIQSGNAEAVVNEFTDTALILPPDGRTIAGRGAMLAFAREGIEGGLCDLISETLEVMADGDIAVENGKSTFVIDQGGSKIEMQAWYLMAYQRQPDGDWRVTRDMWVPLPA